jgi:hypothetical protein
MARALISSDNSFLRNFAGVCVAIVAIPTIIAVKLIVMPFEKPIERSASEVLSILQDFRDGTGDDCDWDDFTSIPVVDVELEDIRAIAASLDLPFGDAELAGLRSLITRTEALVAQSISL